MQAYEREENRMSYPCEQYYRQTPVRTFDLNKTLYQTVFEQNANNMNSEAIGFLGYRMTFAELKRKVDRLADAYRKAGVKEGDTVAICTISMPIVQENLLALSKLGATSKWIDLRIKGKDLVKNLKESHCRILVVFEGVVDAIVEIMDETELQHILVASPKTYLNPVIRLLANLKDKKEGKYVCMPKDVRFERYSDFVASGSKNSSWAPVEFNKDRPSIIVQSSGSTGRAKSIIHTEYNFNSCMQKEAYTDLQFAVGRTMYVAIPPFIIYGLNNSVYAALAFGMKAEMSPFVSETTVFDGLGKYDFACAAPLHYRYLYKQIMECQEKEASVTGKERKNYKTKLAKIRKKLARVKCFVSGGDRISVQELVSMEQLFETPIINGYGNNELTGAAIISPVYANRPEAVGIPMKGIRVAAFEVDTEEMLEQGTEGEICIQSDCVFEGYLNNEEETKRVKRVHEDGLFWIHSGDLGYVDSDGYVYITGRAKRLIKREAFKIAPESIESVILELDEVKDCVVVGVSEIEREGSSVPMAYVELMDPSMNRVDEIKRRIEEKCRAELPEYECPEYIEMIDKIPYKNTKHDFKTLEAMGEEYIRIKKS